MGNSVATTGVEVPVLGRSTVVAERLSTIVVALLFFLGSADLVFATRLFGLNFRWAQGLLFVSVLASLPQLLPMLRARSAAFRRDRALVGAWMLFFALYLLAVFFADFHLRSGIKLAWGVFNITGAGLLCLHGVASPKTLRDGFIAGALAVAGVIWIDALAIYWFGAAGPLLGRVQESYLFEGAHQLRPHGFYYEPSYAGAWLAFATLVLLAATWNMPRWIRLIVPTVSLGAVVLTSARTGILSVLVAGSLTFVVALARRDVRVLRRLLALGVLTTALLAVFFLPERAAVYGRFITGPLGPQRILKRISPREETPTEPAAVKPLAQARSASAENPTSAPALALREKLEHTLESSSQEQRNSSEGQRLANMLRAIGLWTERPIFGWGVLPTPDQTRVLSPGQMNTWLEVLVESGLLGFLAFAGAIGVSIRSAVRGADRTLLTLLAGAWVAHFVVNLNLTQTFPRLDYWLLFFVTLRLARTSSERRAEP